MDVRRTTSCLAPKAHAIPLLTMIYVVAVFSILAHALAIGPMVKRLVIRGSIDADVACKDPSLHRSHTLVASRRILLKLAETQRHQQTIEMQDLRVCGTLLDCGIVPTAGT